WVPVFAGTTIWGERGGFFLGGAATSDRIAGIRSRETHARARGQSARDPRPLGASAGPGSRSRHGRGIARATADEARRGARPARGTGRLARHLAGAPSAAARPSAHSGVRG